MKKATPALLLGGLALAACLQAQAAEPQATQTQATEGADNAVMVGIDAKTRQLRPLTAAEAKSLATRAAAMPQARGSYFATVPRTDAQVRATVRHLSNGATSARAPLSAMNELSASRDANGELNMTEGQPGDAAPITQQEVIK